MSVSKERKNEIIKEYATHEGHHSYVGLLKKIGHRRNLLRYLQENDLERYRALIARLGLRR